MMASLDDKIAAQGYRNFSHVRCAYHGSARVSPLQHRYNDIMSRQRIAIEWSFAKVKQRCPYSCQSRLLKLGACDVARNIRVCVFMTSIHTTLHQSQTGLYFQCFAPTLAQYLA